MALKLMYITNNPKVALIAQRVGVDVIFVDMEYIGKDERQAGLDSVKNKHTVEDVKNIRKVVTSSELLVRVNPIHEKTDSYCSSEEEISAVINEGADIIMLPYFKSVEEVEFFIKTVGGKAKTCLLLETPEAVECLDEILKLKGIDQIHIGLNDLSLGYKKKFMFELLVDGIVEKICRKIEKFNIPYGFGGIARINNGMIPAELIIKEHYRLGSNCAILSRSFCNTLLTKDINEINEVFDKGIREIRDFENSISNGNVPLDNCDLINKINYVIEGMLS